MISEYIPGDNRVGRDTPLILDHMKVRVTYSTEQHLECDVLLSCCPAREILS